MKIRTSFVSNSSSSSFICKTKLSQGDIKNKLEETLSFYNKMMDSNLEFADVFEEPFIANKEYAKRMKEDWSADNIDVKGSAVIESASDNTIPYELFEFIKIIFKRTQNSHGIINNKGGVMKIRTGFVSNSSSSSFLIYGVEIDKETIEKYIAAELIPNSNLSIFNVMGESWYLGRGWNSIGDNETGKEFKDSIEKELKEKFNSSKAHTISESWYDG